MANIKQQKKRIITNNKRRLRNSDFKSSTKTYFKKLKNAKDLREASLYYSIVCKKLDKGLSKGIYVGNYVNRKKKSAAIALNNIYNS
ncbi:MAG: 30S ribosomal protein S20 [Pigeon pea little leaf phytoplasma]|uniref:Small ribosomal subunit protein bS20 n=1 Tax=Candidatus Phytoplasma fabacearum TaxID=2982628 RepID=A0ABU8ZSV2_9MOLU|nr:30S ribosomal protein S20 ['Bituminaria bituminosa' little leaf phytoplasma]MDV3148749.1 30S ribosomal protein S20 [Pigeon pea little leaf phytoplasma]MDO7983641.1 30S ribosomal protein S20 ['Bituminaria bituminosa' little leaf phytoplasma]MDO8024036.1 30S ribosomal protein S20 ['Bituminaria bituminosa' little leaf phytoplasma]MDO8030450.1 30S ribosomal protein S20 ['Bituminaria bituminosa' little leaf phytoplasma]MDV3154215.1 30S ribosomal protein S20 [Pigeon pea little leaf phytoplasma]